MILLLGAYVAVLTAPDTRRYCLRVPRVLRTPLHFA
jgi:hypothetical protein